MSTPPSDDATRLGTLLSSAMNISALLHDQAALQSDDPRELRAELLRITDELEWLRALAENGHTSFTWPYDGTRRTGDLRRALEAWDPSNPPPPDVIAAGKDCLGIVVPT